MTDAAATVAYWGSLAEFHGRVFTAAPCRCELPFDECSGARLQLADGSEVVLEHVRPTSVQELAPDGPLHRPARDGDVVRVGRSFARFAYAESVVGPSPLRRIWHYVQSGKRWYLSAHLDTTGDRIVRARYTSPEQLRRWRISVDIADAVADLEDNLGRRDGEPFRDEAKYALAADRLERLTCERESFAADGG